GALGIIGDDGEGYELLKGLEGTRVDTSCLAQCPGRFTPTYTKPMVATASGERELERLDIKNRSPLTSELEFELVKSLETALDTSPSAVILLDQVQEQNHGV